VSRPRGQGVVDADVDVARSEDHGVSWSRPVRVNDSRTGDRFMPSLSVMRDGTVGVAFYDRRNGAQRLDVYAARVSFVGQPRASRNIRVNAGTSPVGDIFYIRPGSTCFSPGRFFGDYMGTSTVDSRHLCVTWADTQRRVYNETDVWFARVTLPAVRSVRSRAVARILRPSR
jgi:hypothetical protein